MRQAGAGDADLLGSGGGVGRAGRPPARRAGGAAGWKRERHAAGARSAALKAQCEDIGHALDHLERLKGLFQSFLSPVSELVLEFEACSGRLEETTARLAALEEAHRDLAARHAAALEERDRVAEQAAALDEARLDLGDCRNASEALQRLIEPVSHDSVSRAAEIERLGAELADQRRALAESQAELRAATARCAGLEALLATRTGQARTSGAGAPAGVEASVKGGERRAAT
jgi:chromosome segregation ATPase